MTLPNFSKIYIGDNAITVQIVCTDGQIRNVTTEQFVEGFVAYLTKEDGKYSNHKCYKTAQKARNAAAKW